MFNKVKDNFFINLSPRLNYIYNYINTSLLYCYHSNTFLYNNYYNNENIIPMQKDIYDKLEDIFI